MCWTPVLRTDLSPSLTLTWKSHSLILNLEVFFFPHCDYNVWRILIKTLKWSDSILFHFHFKRQKCTVFYLNLSCRFSHSQLLFSNSTEICFKHCFAKTLFHQHRIYFHHPFILFMTKWDILRKHWCWGHLQLKI